MEKINTPLKTKLITLPAKEEVFSTADLANLQIAAEKIRQGKLVAFPTETVYGLGGNGLDPEAAARIYAAKGRPSDNPLILHFADLAMIKDLLGTIPPLAEQLLTAYAPGPLTVIVPKNNKIPYTVTGGLETVAIRIPDNDVTRHLIKLAKVPLAGPSANTSGKPSPTTGNMVYQDLQGKIDLILDDGPSPVGLESTIVDCSEEGLTILRPGAITMEMLQEFDPHVKLDPALTHSDGKPKAPGMKYKHYAPEAPMALLLGNKTNLISYIHRALQQARAENFKIGLLISEEIAESLPIEFENYFALYIYGKQKDYSTIANKIYSGLRYFNTQKVHYILGEGTEEKGIGLAIMNRLKKAAAGNLINL